MLALTSTYFFSSLSPPPPRSTLFPYTTLFRSKRGQGSAPSVRGRRGPAVAAEPILCRPFRGRRRGGGARVPDRRQADEVVLAGGRGPSAAGSDRGRQRGRPFGRLARICAPLRRAAVRARGVPLVRRRDRRRPPPGAVDVQGPPPLAADRRPAHVLGDGPGARRSRIPRLQPARRAGLAGDLPTPDARAGRRGLLGDRFEPARLRVDDARPRCR